MSSIWYFNPFSLPLFIIGIIAALFVVYSLTRRHVPAAISFAATCFCTACWALGAVLQVSTSDLGIALTAAKLQQIGYIGIAPCWFIFACFFTGRDAWMTRPRIAAVLAGPLVMLAFFWTNDLHQWMFTDARVVTSSFGFNLEVTFQPLFWVHTAIAYTLIVAGTALILSYALTADRMYRSRVIGLIAASIIPIAANIVNVSGLNPMPIDITPLAFGISLIAFALNIFRYQLFDVVPLTYDKLLGTLRDGVIVLDPYNIIVQINTAALAILSQPDAKSVIGRRIDDLLAPYQQQIQPFLNPHNQDMEGEVRIESASRPPSDEMTGASRWFSVRVSPMLAPGTGKTIMQGKVAVLSEITNRKLNELALAEARDQALQLDQFKTQMLSQISHDFRTPLAAIQGYAELLREGFYDLKPTQKQDAFSSILENTKYLNQLVGQLLDKSQLTSGQIEIVHAPFDPRLLAEGTLEGLLILAEMKGLTCDAIIDPDLPPLLMGDRARLQQIITNLVGNALKFTEYGRVTLHLAVAHPDRWTIRVTDTGPGIPLQSRAIIFEPFRQLNTPRRGAKRGFGLGLSIVKDLVTMMNGSIAVESVVGEGSTFVVTLPLIAAPPQEPKHDSIPTPVSAGR